MPNFAKTTVPRPRLVLTLDDFQPVPSPYQGAYLAVGNFDGVHRGHLHLLARLKANADAAGAPSIALTFDPSPAAVLRPDAAPPSLTWPERRFALIRATGVSEVAVFRTGRWLLGLTARAFFDRVIREQFRARGMVEGPTFGFGRDRGGDAAVLATWCAAAALDFEVAEPIDIGGRIVSSSRVRRLIAEGDVREATKLLGRPHRLRGTVVRGAGRGRGIGTPTANLSGVDVLVPADGVYAGLARTDSTETPVAAAVHIGPNVTFGATARTVEAHLIDFEGDLYGQSVELDFLERIRPTAKFESVAALIEQMRRDVDQARMIAHAASLPSRPS